jgi:hypothetical protein
MTPQRQYRCISTCTPNQQSLSVIYPSQSREADAALPQRILSLKNVTNEWKRRARAMFHA